uniref:Uncharacterized protein n=1 Tax=Spongospora subterranea TaxID=70186 RepID=A0A0H5QIW2_9EUKA|eukprot:CRZ02040.1 hypothetical protein [Spongospora subterranea]
MGVIVYSLWTLAHHFRALLPHSRPASWVVCDIFRPGGHNISLAHHTASLLPEFGTVSCPYIYGTFGSYGVNKHCGIATFPREGSHAPALTPDNSLFCCFEIGLWHSFDSAIVSPLGS